MHGKDCGMHPLLPLSVALIMLKSEDGGGGWFVLGSRVCPPFANRAGLRLPLMHAAAADNVGCHASRYFSPLIVVLASLKRSVEMQV